MTFGNRIFNLFIMEIFYVGITILIRKPLRTRRNFFAFLAPLTGGVWFFMAIAYIGSSIKLIYKFNI
jgi:hypothetical protein